MIYFDNAATGGFKPYSVQEVVPTVIKHLCANPTRSSHRLSAVGGEMVFKTRMLLKEFFNAPSAERVIFTKNCTEALNTVILGLLKKGDHAVISCMEHNSVLRPLNHLKAERGVTFDVITPKKEAFFTQKAPISYKDVRGLIKPDTRLVLINHASNVNGALADVYDIGINLRQEFPNVLFAVDGAQSGGHLPIDVKKFCIDALCLACHKGLGGIMGSGALILSDRCDPAPLTMGGTGSDSFNLHQPDYYPDRLESGTLNLPAIVALYEGLLHTQASFDFSAHQLPKMTEHLISALSQTDGATTYSLPNAVGIVAFSVNTVPSQTVAQILSDEYDIAVRAGFHCAPLMHRALHTHEDGLVRVSLSPQNTFKEISTLLKAVKEIIKSN